MSTDNRLAKMSHISNIARFCGLASPDLLVLQSFMVVASSTNALYNVLQPKPLYVPFSYGAVFTLLSASIVARIASERFVSLTDEEQRIYDAHCGETFDRPTFKKIITLSRGVKDIDTSRHPDERIKVMRKGDTADLYLLLDGDAEITFHEPRKAVVPRGPGLIGEIGFTRAYASRQSGGAALPAVADIDMVGAGSRWVSWDGDVLRQAMVKDPSLKKSVDHLVGLSLSSKLRSAYLDGAEVEKQMEGAGRSHGRSYKRLWSTFWKDREGGGSARER